MNLYLASASPRRTQLLSQLGFAHRVFPVDIDESPKTGEKANTLVARLAREKASAGIERLFAQPADDEGDAIAILAADTLIVLDGEPVGKPKDMKDSIRILSLLSQREHQVITAVSIAVKGELDTISVCTDVRMAPISEAEIVAYWNTGEPQDKAGSYAIQGVGGRFVQAINGSYSAVVGLPLYETAQLLKKYGVNT